MSDDWPKSTCTNANAATEENTFTPEKLRAMVRKMDAFVSDDVIAVSMLFPPDKALEFPDDKGKVWAIGLAAWHRLKAEAERNKPIGAADLLGSGPAAPFLGMRVVFEHDGEVWDETVQRILRSMEAAVGQSEFMSRLMLELKLMGSTKAETP